MGRPAHQTPERPFDKHRRLYGVLRIGIDFYLGDGVVAAPGVVMRVYICTMQASRRQGNEVYTVCSWLVAEASSEATATGMAYIGCKEKFPMSDGWGRHSVGVEEFPQNVIDMILRVYFPDLWEKEAQP